MWLYRTDKHLLVILSSFSLLILTFLSRSATAHNDSTVIGESLQTYLHSGISDREQEKDFLFKDNVPSSVSISLLQSFLARLNCEQPCQQCFWDEQLIPYFENKTHTSFVFTSKMLILLALEASNLCTSTGVEFCQNEACLDAMLNNHFDKAEQNSSQFTAQQIDNMLRKIQTHYNAADDSISGEKCFNGSKILSEASNNTSKSNSTRKNEIRHSGKIYAIIARHLLAGNCICIDDDKCHFNNLFALYGDTVTATNGNTRLQRINETGFLHFLGDLHQLPGLCEVDDDHEHDHNDHDHHHHHNHPEGDGHHHVHRRTRRSPHLDPAGKLENPSQSRNSDKKCLEWRALFDESDLDHSDNLNGQELLHACPGILNLWAGNYADKGKTEAHPHDNVPCEIDCDSSFRAKAYGYGTLSVAIISLCSIAGVLIIPCMNSSVYKYAITTLIAMGFGILTGDAILHLIPQAFGLHEVFHEHVHTEGDSHDHGHSHSEEDRFPPYVAKSIALLGAIYALFLFEGISNAFLPDHHNHHQDNHQDNDQRSKTQKKYGTDGQDRNHAISLKVCSDGNRKTVSREVLTNHTDDQEYPAQNNYAMKASMDDLPTEFANTAPVICCGFKSLALVILLGDTIHNFADGLVIGAAFASGIEGGISASLAIFCHELPHEFGDFAILLSTGLSKGKVLIFNLLSSLSAFIGLYIGLALGSDEATVQWIMAITAGMFLFVALGDMMPELKALRTKNTWISLILQNFGVLLGLGFIILLSIYEHDIHI